MKKMALSAALYGAPALITLLVFAAGHSTISPQSDRLDALNPPSPPIETEAVPENPENTDASAQATDEAGFVLATPGYEYYPYPSTIIGNVPGTNKLFSFEIAVSIFESPLNASNMMTTLEEREPQLRPLILAQAVDLDEETLLSREGRQLLSEKIKTTINDYLERWGYEPFIHSVELTSFLIT
jgi:flagellar basal body-associated protein FliL